MEDTDEQQAQLDEAQPQLGESVQAIETTGVPADFDPPSAALVQPIEPDSDELVGAYAVYDDDLLRYTGPTFDSRADADDYRAELQRESGHVFVVHDL